MHFHLVRIFIFLFLLHLPRTLLAGLPEGTGGVFLDRSKGGVTELPGAVVDGSVTIIRIGACYSMSTLDSTSYDDQEMRVGEERWLRYVVQNQGNRRDSISFEASLSAGRTVMPELTVTGTDSAGTGAQCGIWLAPGKIGTVLVRISIPAGDFYTDGDTLQFKIDVKNQHGTGGGPDSTDGWPGKRTVYRRMALFAAGPRRQLTDRTALTGSQDWMVDRFAVLVTGGKKSAPPVPEPAPAATEQVHGMFDVVTGPHPFSDYFRISCRLPERTHLYTGVFDLSGNPVRILSDSYRDAGEHVFTWDGTDRNGVRVRHGLYVLKVRTGPVNRTEIIMYAH